LASSPLGDGQDRPVVGQDGGDATESVPCGPTTRALAT
jgi:hypothetical protein